MSTFSIALVGALLLAGMVAFRSASSSSLQGAHLERRLIYRLVEFFSAVLIWGVAEINAPNVFTALIPAGVLLVYILLCIVIKQTKKQAATDVSQRANELKEAALSAGVSVMVSTCIVLLIAMAAINMPKLHLDISDIDIRLTHGLLLTTSSLLIIFLSRLLVLYWRNHEERDDSNQALLKLQRRLRKPPTMR